MNVATKLKPAETFEPSAPRRNRYGIYIVGLLAAATFLGNVDGAVMSVVAGRVQTEFLITDIQVGALISAYTIALALTTIPIGYLADRWPRRTILGVGMAVWSVATLLTGLTRPFFQMFAARALTGIGEATIVPVTTSLIGDQFPASSRGRAMGAVSAAIGLGQAVGIIGIGAIAVHFGWRWAFYLAGIPALLLVPLFLTMREPLRGAAEHRGPQIAGTRDAGVRNLVRLFRIPSYTAAVWAAGFGAFGIGVIQFIFLYLNRRFGLDPAQAAALVGLPTLVGGTAGLALCGWLVDWRGKKSRGAAVEVAIAGLGIAAVAAAAAFSVPSLAGFVAAVSVFTFTAGAAIIAPPLVLQSVIVPSLRASAAGMQNTLAKLFGFASGPLAVGIVSALTGGDLGLSLRVLAPAAFLAAGICFALAMRSIKSDTASMEERWAAQDRVSDGGPGS
jgi:MFS transporter, Spinster family, sphingosine-1-phosphate transporter